MAYDFLKLIRLTAGFAFPFLFKILIDSVKSIIHNYTYKQLPDAKNVVVIGGSFAGVEMARKLMHSLPTGYKVILIERNSHFNYTFNFPRYSVLQGHEKLAFIPYDGLSKNAPEGIFEHLRGEVTSLTNDSVVLRSGISVPYAFAVIATGTTQQPPTKLTSTNRDEACVELQDIQQRVKAADKIAIVGGGAVGIELATDIKSYYPEKDVTVVHSRDQLLPRFGPRLHDHVLATLQSMKINVVLNERPQVQAPDDHPGIAKSVQRLTFQDGKVVEYDLVIPCTGQIPNTSIVADLLPTAISSKSGYIHVQPTLQVLAEEKSRGNIFAIGDIAETGGPKMARASFFQVSVVQKNILALIRGQTASAEYKPQPAMEGALKLTLGKTDYVLYCQTDDGEEIMITSKRGKEDLDVKGFWKRFGANWEGMAPTTKQN